MDDIRWRNSKNHLNLFVFNYFFVYIFNSLTVDRQFTNYFVFDKVIVIVYFHTYIAVGLLLHTKFRFTQQKQKKITTTTTQLQC